MVLEHALVHAAGDRQQLVRLAGGDRAPARWGRRRPKVVAVKHEGRRRSSKVRVVLRPVP
ncbi:MAG: hypothetical protein JWO68_1735 [Actinomycetia bacterium]|nr:hypothetical protein [Actinomycetes bacterium]